MNNRDRELKNITSLEFNIDAKYDIILDPVADDDIAATIRRFMGEKLDEEGLRKRLTYRKLNNQYSFHTEKAIAYLRKVGTLGE